MEDTIMYLQREKRKEHDETYMDRIQECRVSNDIKFLRDMVITETDIYILRAIAENEFADDFMMNSLLKLKRDIIDTAIAGNNNASEETLYQISYTTMYDKTLFALLNNNNCSIRIIEKVLATRIFMKLSDEIYYSIAEHVHSSFEILKSLSRTHREEESFKKSLFVRIIQNKNVSFETLMFLADRATEEDNGYILSVLESRGVFEEKKELEDLNKDLIAS